MSKANKVKAMRKIDEFERKILNLERNKQIMMKDEFYENDRVTQMRHIEKITEEIRYVKLDKDKLAEKLASMQNDDGKLYLSQIIDLEKPEFGTNNLILSPVGSGKTTFIEELICNKDIKKSLMLVSNTYLKDSLTKETKISGVFTTRSRLKYKLDEDKVHLMTYSEFGRKIYSNNDFIKESDFEYIFCDEIHSLPEYQQYKNTPALSHAIKYLFNPQENIRIFYFTATDENLKLMYKKQSGIDKYVKTFNYLKHKDIKRYIALSEYKINHIEQIRPHLKARQESFEYFGHKGLAFARTIEEMKKIETILIEEGYNPLLLWSSNNVEQPLDKQQLEDRDNLLYTNEIPEPYNFIVINSALREGWDLRDSKIKLAIINTTNTTDKTQAIGRIRKDIDVLVYKSNDNEEAFIDANDLAKKMLKYVNRNLTTEDKAELCSDLNVTNKRGKVAKWTTIRRLLEANDYEITNKSVRQNKKTFQATIITYSGKECNFQSLVRV